MEAYCLIQQKLCLNIEHEIIVNIATLLTANWERRQKFSSTQRYNRVLTTNLARIALFWFAGSQCILLPPP